MENHVKIGNKKIGPGEQCFIIGEIGINHNSDINIAKKLIDVAKEKGFDAVKFQKRNPDVCVPEDQKSREVETPWGKMTYIEYKHKMEFGEKEYKEIDDYCREKDIIWFASPWDLDSIDFLEKFNVPCHKVPSCMLTDHEFLLKLKNTGKPIILSTGMSTLEQIDAAMDIFDDHPLVVLHCTSTYPCQKEELNLSFIPVLRERYGKITGYSGHEVGVTPSILAVAAFDAHVVERHITLNRSLWGTDQAASLEPRGMELLARDIRSIPDIKGSGKKVVYDSEVPIMKKLRKKI